LEGIALCGSLPGGVTGSTFSTIIQNKTPSTVVFLDACRDLDVMKTGLVDILKINSEEAISIANLEYVTFIPIYSFVTDLVQVGEEILKQFQVKIVAITSGPNTYFKLFNL
jgi:fructose-1-phosphate kinase PfkB-like protein